MWESERDKNKAKERERERAHLLNILLYLRDNQADLPFKEEAPRFSNLFTASTNNMLTNMHAYIAFCVSCIPTKIILLIIWKQGKVCAIILFYLKKFSTLAVHNEQNSTIYLSIIRIIKCICFIDALIKHYRFWKKFTCHLVIWLRTEFRMRSQKKSRIAIWK